MDKKCLPELGCCFPAVKSKGSLDPLIAQQSAEEVPSDSTQVDSMRDVTQGTSYSGSAKGQGGDCGKS